MFFKGYIITEPTEYIVWSLVTISVGTVVSLYGMRPGLVWAITAGVVRWFTVIAIFTFEAILDLIGLSNHSVIGQLLTFHFLAELPLMIAGYVLGWILYKLGRFALRFL